MMILYFSGILRREAGTLGAREISSSWSIISERLKKRVETIQIRQENKRCVLLVLVNRFIPSRYLHLIGSSRWATLDDDTTLILRFSRISEKFCLQMGDIAIKLLKLVRKRIIL